MLEIGDILHNRYRIIRQLGEGGMGAVYEAEDNQRFGKSVALKEILVNLTNQNPEHFRRAFEREAKILTQIDHEAVPKVVGYFLETDCQILVMELIEGDDLDEILEKRQKPFPLVNVLNWTHQLLDALDYLHTLRPPIIHRDIKPQNLKLTTRNKIKLLDFGIAKGTELEITLTKMPQKTFVGATLYYSPMEQIIRIPDYYEMIQSFYPEKAKKISQQAADARSDIYSLGATLYHLLTNGFPRPAHLRALEIWGGKADSLEPLNNLVPDIPQEISNWLHKSLEIERENRYGSILEMQTALQLAILQAERRSEEEERMIWFAEQEKIRLELETERRRLEEERRKQEQLKAEAELREKEKREYEAKLEKWQSENLPDSLSSPTKPTTHTQLYIPPRSSENLPVQKNFGWSETTQENELAETRAPLYQDSSGFYSEPPKLAAETIKNVKSQTASNHLAPSFLTKNLLWVLPVAIAAIFIFGISAFGIFLLFSGSGSGSENKSVKIPVIASPTASPTISQTPVPTAEPTTTPTPTVSENEKSKTTVAPTVSRTQTTQNPVKTPAVERTPRPVRVPDRSDDCVYNGKCKN